MIEFEIVPGLVLQIDPEKFEVISGFHVAGMANPEAVLTLDMNIHDILEDTDGKVEGLIKLWSKP